MSVEAPVPVKTRSEIQSPLAALHRAMNTVFEDFEHGFGLTTPVPSWGWNHSFVPEMDVSEDPQRYTVQAELPGMDEKNIEVTVDDHQLILKGEKRDEREEKGKGYFRSERHFGSFTRTVPFTCEIDKEKVRATFKNGLLNIELPKTVDAQVARRKVPVRSE